MSLALLLDTHALLWWAHQPGSLSTRAYDAVTDGENEVFVSPVSAFEIATKTRKGKLGFVSGLASDFTVQMRRRNFLELPISAEHAQLAGSFESPHKDPWDRLLAAQATIDGLTLVTSDAEIAGLGVATLW